MKTGDVIAEMLTGYEGVVLADASLIFDTLFRDHGMTESGCWSHARRYFWKAVEMSVPALSEGALLT